MLIGADGNGGIVSTMTNHDLVFRSGVNTTRMTIQAAGNVGINTQTPAVQLHVVGNRIRLEDGGKHIDLRTDGSSVDLHSETNSVFIRSSGGAGNNNILMNSFPGDGAVGVGTSIPAAKLHVVDSKAGSAGDITQHVAIIENLAGADADVLAIKMGASPATAGNNFITFFSGSGAVGAIEGNGSGISSEYDRSRLRRVPSARSRRDRRTRRCGRNRRRQTHPRHSRCASVRRDLHASGGGRQYGPRIHPAGACRPSRTDACEGARIASTSATSSSARATTMELPSRSRLVKRWTCAASISSAPRGNLRVPMALKTIRTAVGMVSSVFSLFRRRSENAE